MVRRRIIVGPFQFDGSKDRFDLAGTIRVTFLSGFRFRRRERGCQRLQKPLEKMSAVPKQGLSQSQFQGFQIADAFLFPLLANQSQERFGFVKLLVGEFRALKFFFEPGAALSNWVSCSLRLTKSSASF